MNGPKLAVDLTRLGRGFCFAPRRTVPFSQNWERLRHRPEELVTCACPGLAPSRRGGPHQLQLAFPRLPGRIPVAPRRVFHAAALSTVLSRNTGKMRPAAREVHGLLRATCSPLRAVNNLWADAADRLFTGNSEAHRRRAAAPEAARGQQDASCAGSGNGVDRAAKLRTSQPLHVTQSSPLRRA